MLVLGVRQGDSLLCKNGEWHFKIRFIEANQIHCEIDQIQIKTGFYLDGDPFRICRNGSQMELKKLSGRKIGLDGLGWEFRRVV